MGLWAHDLEAILTRFGEAGQSSMENTCAAKRGDQEDRFRGLRHAFSAVTWSVPVIDPGSQGCKWQTRREAQALPCPGLCLCAGPG